MQKRRDIELVVISDIHLGVLGCNAKGLLHYLNSIQPKKLILIGDFMERLQFIKSHIPKDHLEVINKIIKLSNNGTEVIYITGSHNEMQFSGLKLGNFVVVDKLVLDLDGKLAWFFNGDVLDFSFLYSKWLANIDVWSYNVILKINKLFNWNLITSEKRKFSKSKKNKNNLELNIKDIQLFEKRVSDLAIENEYKYVISGHTHQPKIIRKTNIYGTCLYLNSGKWIENLTTLEYNNKRWELNKFDENTLTKKEIETAPMERILDLITAITILNKVRPQN
ncbi:UDP-2,3-diacylglucosamine diphosphatase [Gillisia sp. Hel_I_29]|uniref:UDP-2,3-diacylglucosamine diphosphatase n=1 Tax=Gillisia sp. Hel_I_29 TaxID=1249975 RepID=UPI00054D2EC9|nr:UDP-2,3-diacylglucosamine diphosphatase [Gillisia sp. Hel_I_29]